MRNFSSIHRLLAIASFHFQLTLNYNIKNHCIVRLLMNFQCSYKNIKKCWKIAFLLKCSYIIFSDIPSCHFWHTGKFHWGIYPFSLASQVFCGTHFFVYRSSKSTADITCRAVALHCCKAHVKSEWGKGDFWLFWHQSPLNFSNLNLRSIPEMYISANFHLNLFSGGFSPGRWNVTVLWLDLVILYFLFSGTYPGRIHR